jgi:hypothetical protein
MAIVIWKRNIVKFGIPFIFGNRGRFGNIHMSGGETMVSTWFGTISLKENKEKGYIRK